MVTLMALIAGIWVGYALGVLTVIIIDRIIGIV